MNQHIYADQYPKGIGTEEIKTTPWLFKKNLQYQFYTTDQLAKLIYILGLNWSKMESCKKLFTQKNKM